MCVCVFVCVEGVCVCAHLGVSASIATSFKTEYRHAHTHITPCVQKRRLRLQNGVIHVPLYFFEGRSTQTSGAL